MFPPPRVACIKALSCYHTLDAVRTPCGHGAYVYDHVCVAYVTSFEPSKYAVDDRVPQHYITIATEAPQRSRCEASGVVSASEYSDTILLPGLFRS